MRVINLQAENIKRLVAVDITPQDDVVVISGKNANGKSSVLDAIWWTLEGASHIQSVPIRRGANEARIRLDLGEIIVTRRFKKDAKGEVTTGVIVESAKGARFAGPQTMLDELLGSLCMDPLAFAELGETPEGKRQQLKILQVFVPGYNFDEQDGLNKKDEETRRDVNKLVLQSKAAADLINVPDGTPSEEEDEAALVASLEAAGKANALNAKRRENRAAGEARLQTCRTSKDLVGAKLDVALANEDRECREALDRLRAEMDRVEAARIANGARLITESCDEAEALQAEIDHLEQKFANAEAVPDDTDTEVIRANIATARKENINVRRKIERDKLLALHAQYDAEAKALTNNMLARQAAKRAAIAAAQMPVPGLDFGISEILLNGLPFDQASSAERLRTSIAIAIAQKPKLRVLRIVQGSLLDSDGMAIVREMAAEHDFQVWVEVVSDGQPGEMKFVIEEGRIKAA